MTIIGITISLAGRPRMNARRMYPSIPSSRPKGSKIFALRSRMLIPLTLVFAISHITRPAGAATATALARTNMVLSKSDLTKIRPIWGFL